MTTDTFYNAGYKFKQDYGKSMLIVSPLLVYMFLLYLSAAKGLLGESLISYIGPFLISTLLSFIVLKLTLQFVRDEMFDLREAFEPKSAILQYAIYSIIMFVISYLFEYLVGDISIDLVFRIVTPFDRFIEGAKTPLGFGVRVMLAFNFLSAIYVLIIFLVFHKFVLVPYIICDGDTIIEAFSSSISETTDYFGEMFQTFLAVAFRLFIMFNVYIFIVLIVAVNNMKTGDFILNMMNYIVLGFIIFYFFPLINIILATLHKKIRG